MADYTKMYLDLMEHSNLYDQALLEKPGMWECWLLEDNEVVLIDIMKATEERITATPNMYMGKRIKKKLGYTMHLYNALKMFEYYKENWWREELQK